MGSRSGTADRDTLAAQVFCFLDLGSHVQTIIELEVKVGDADEIRAAQPGVEEMPWPDDRGIDFTSEQRRNRERISRHQNKLRIEAVLLEQPEVARDPDGGHG